jgi:UBX domain-containing protein 1
VPSKQKLKAFSGVGHMLGSPTPVVTSDPGATGEDKPEPKKEEEEVAPREPPFTLDSSSPTTTVQIRLADGTRLQATLNHGHTVADLRRFIVYERPQYTNVPFNLLNSYPSKLLTDDGLTLESAGILNASLLQRLV